MAVVIVALGVRGVRADEPAAAGASQDERGFLEPLSDLALGNFRSLLPPLPAPPDASDASPKSEDRPTLLTARATAQYGYRWQEGDELVVLLRGRCTIQDAGTTLMADEAVIWYDQADPTAAPLVYLSGNARLEQSGHSLSEPTILTTLAAKKIAFNIPSGGFIERSQAADPLYQRAVARRQEGFAEEVHSAARPPVLPPPPGALGEAGAGNGGNGAVRRVRVYPRSALPFNVQSIESTDTLPPEQVTVITGGVNILIDSINRATEVVDLRADRAVIWTQALQEGFQTQRLQSDETPFTVYLEGNIILLQGNHKIMARRAIYDARSDRALILDAELKSFLPQLGANVRIRARQMRQISEGRFHAQDAWTTTSIFGKPTYRVQSSEIFYYPRYDLDMRWLGAGKSVVDPATGMEMVKTNWMRSYNNTVYIRDVPVFYSPYFAGPAEEIKIPLRQLSVGKDRIFGYRARSVWDLYQLLGLEPTPGVTANLLADYYSYRGPGGGLSGKYSGDDLFGLNDSFRGYGIGYYVHDHGFDRMGMTRNHLPVKNPNRWRLLWRHQHSFANHIDVNAEIGVLSDRNFLEQYFQTDFDNRKDQETVLYATQPLTDLGLGNWGWELLGKAPLNRFESVTGWYPKGDLWGLSQPLPLFGGRLTWSSHSTAGYGNLHAANPSAYQNATYFQQLPYLPNASGAVLMTRHQLDLPIPIGPLQLVPFAMGGAAFWGQGVGQQDIGRLTGSAGVRSSIQFQKVMPQVYNRTLGLNGLAHKIRLEGTYRLTKTSQPLGAIAQYNNIDDNAQERLRYRIPGAYFGGDLPSQLNPRIYGVRAGVGTPLGSPYYELISDQQVARLAVRQRLQTKSGPPGRLRIRDWMTLDTGLSLFPRANRDNFGRTAGLIFANYAWMFSEQTQLKANMQIDLFDKAARIWNVGVQSKRDYRGSYYLGLRRLQFGGIESDMLLGSYTYVMSPKWLSTMRMFVDLQNARNRSHLLTLTRVGPDFLIHIGIQNNTSTKNFGVTFAIQPRFGNFNSASNPKLSSLLRPPINP